MNFMVSLFVYLFVVAWLCLYPVLGFLVSRRWGKRVSVAVVVIVLVVQTAILMPLYQKPNITFADAIGEPMREKTEAWAHETLAGPYSGFYSPRLPIFACRFHITAISDDYIAAQIFYLPLGIMEVEWDSSSLYNITKPLQWK